jgi:hypothetical protein
MGDSMSTIINATTTNGVVIQPDNSGSLVLQTNSGTTALTISTAQNATFAAQATIPTINLTGGQIVFPATQSTSSDANTLDDYEEGTFTPTAFGGSSAGTTTYIAQSAYYTKIGRQVNVIILVAWSALTGTGTLNIGNLPFSLANLSQSNPIGSILTSNLNWSGGTTIIAEGQPNTTNILCIGLADDAAATIQQCVNEAADMRVTMTYFTA